MGVIRRFESSPLHADSPQASPLAVRFANCRRNQRRDLWPAHIHGPSLRPRIPALETVDRIDCGIAAVAGIGTNRRLNDIGEEGTVYAPIARISNVLARHGVDLGRNPRWIENADAEQIARVNEAMTALRQK